MRCLIDENLSHKVRHYLGEHDAVTAAYAGFAGLKNGQLLDGAERAGFDILVTADKTLHFEQNMRGRRIAIVLLSANSWPVIEPYVEKIRGAVDTSLPGSVVRVECGNFSRATRQRTSLE